MHIQSAHTGSLIPNFWDMVALLQTPHTNSVHFKESWDNSYIDTKKGSSKVFLNQGCVGLQIRDIPTIGLEIDTLLLYIQLLSGLLWPLFYTHYACLNRRPFSVTDFLMGIKHSSSTNKATHLSPTCLSHLPSIILTFTPKVSEPAYLPPPLFQGSLHTTQWST